MWNKIRVICIPDKAYHLSFHLKPQPLHKTPAKSLLILHNLRGSVVWFERINEFCIKIPSCLESSSLCTSTNKHVHVLVQIYHTSENVCASVSTFNWYRFQSGAVVIVNFVLYSVSYCAQQGLDSYFKILSTLHTIILFYWNCRISLLMSSILKNSWWDFWHSLSILRNKHCNHPIKHCVFHGNAL